VRACRVGAVAQAVIQELKSLLNSRRTDEEALLTVESLSDYLHVSKQWVYERVHLKEIPCIKVGKFPRFKKSEIDFWLETLKVPSSRAPSISLRAVR
jgi:excisionase family DNA binding protein